MKISTICVLGGTGFVGRHLVPRLASGGHHVTVLSRRPHRHRELGVTPGIWLRGADIHDPDVLLEQFRNVDCVINLVGILNEFPRHGSTFRKVHVDLPKKVVEACHKAGVRRLLHMSSLNADEARGVSEYLRTKGKGENQCHTIGKPNIGVTSFRPSVIFGPGDSFFNRFAQLLRRTPWIFPLACAQARFAPVYVGDVAAAFSQVLDDPSSYGKHFDLCGPRSFTLQELAEYTSKTLGLQRKIIRLTKGLSKLQANALEFFPGKPFSYDNYLSMQVDSICQENGLETLGILPTDIESVVPRYLIQKSIKSQYAQYRRFRHRE